MPFFKDKGDVYIDASTNCINKGDITVGHAFSNGFGAYAGVGFSRENSSNIILKPVVPFACTSILHNYGLGYFVNWAKSEQFRFEMYGDLCLAKYYINLPSGVNGSIILNNGASLSGNYRRIGALINLGMSDESRPFETGYTVRFSNIDFYKPKIVNEERLEEEVSRLNHQRNYWLLEHGMFARTGGDVVKFQMQFSVYHGLYTNGRAGAIQQLNMSAMLGLVINTNFLDD